MGFVVDFEDATYNLYKDYAHSMGFNFQKGRKDIFLALG